MQKMRKVKIGFITSTQFGLEHRDKGLYLAKVGHQVHMLRMWLTPNGLQSVHVDPANSNSKDLDARLPREGCNLLNLVLRPSVSHNHSDSWDVQVGWSCPIFLSEGCFHGVLDGQTSHCACGKVLHVPHGLLHLSPGCVCVKWEFRLDHAAVLEQTDVSGVRANIQELEQVDDEGLDPLVIMWADASGAVDDKDEIQRGGFARVICDGKDVTVVKEPNYVNLQILTSTKGGVISFIWSGLTTAPFVQKSRLCIVRHKCCWQNILWSLTGHSPTALVWVVVSFCFLAAMSLGRRLSSRTASQHSRKRTPRARDLMLTRADNWSI